MATKPRGGSTGLSGRTFAASLSIIYVKALAQCAVLFLNKNFDKFEELVDYVDVF